MAMDIISEYREEDPRSPYLLRRDAFIEDQSFNRNLKVIAGPKMLNWPRERTIYNKLGRKTNAQLYIRFGAGRPQLSRMLGHERESTTKSYFHINLAEIIEGVKSVDFVRLGIGVWPS